jgi:D-serine deaminase-like pyridoxal phosphate-dependent protein
MPASDPATLDRAALAALADERLGWQFKAVPPAWWGRTVHEVLADAPRLSELPTPLLSVSAAAIEHNVATMRRWCAEHGLDLAPHGKTTMAPALWAAQLDAGAWAITLANPSQLAVARAFGVSRVLIANEVISPLALRWIAAELAADDGFQVLVWADSVRTVELMAAAVPADGRPLDVLVEVGGHGGRTGTRDRETALAVGRAVATAPALRLAGVGGYEAALGNDTAAPGLDRIRAYLAELAAVHAGLRPLYDDGLVPVVSAGGSTFFDLVAEVLGPLTEDGARVVLRSGAYIAHDDGIYRTTSPLGAAPRTDGERLVPAIHGWVRVSSQPEPGLALYDAGKRDLPFDEGLPEPQLLRPRSPGDSARRLDGLTVTKVNDQHGFLRFTPNGEAPVRVGDELRLGLSHPCTAFDKWALIPMLDDADSDDPVVVDLVRTFF